MQVLHSTTRRKKGRKSIREEERKKKPKEKETREVPCSCMIHARRVRVPVSLFLSFFFLRLFLVDANLEESLISGVHLISQDYFFWWFFSFHIILIWFQRKTKKTKEKIYALYTYNARIFTVIYIRRKKQTNFAAVDAVVPRFKTNWTRYKWRVGWAVVGQLYTESN